MSKKKSGTQVRTKGQRELIKKIKIPKNKRKKLKVEPENTDDLAGGPF